jgi:hypothetical protein
MTKSQWMDASSRTSFKAFSFSFSFRPLILT